ncbi:ABC transporter [Penicillium malachiteum]|uniref:ABC transporter n=1 Tax=Penicillium malachiteum TaxID=1324776 RepID=UPI0025482927|nr:ABC transporter [Penicillium malachiteum]KAJ5726034.1 ABC transporter [Penicillium malachiteum]
MHSARIRLGGVWNKHEIEEYVDSLMISRGLAHVQHHLVGSPDNRQISRGQRKRVNVGLELAAAPSMLILDEPTSGLDTTTALFLIMSLKALTQRGMAVICVVHQPRVEIFEAFDQLRLLDSGKQVYLDRATDAYQRIAGPGKDLSKTYNPADMIMNLLLSPNSSKVFNARHPGMFKFISTYCEDVPPDQQVFKRLETKLWHLEALFSESTAPQSHIYSLAPAAEETGYTFGRTNFDFGDVAGD